MTTNARRVVPFLALLTSTIVAGCAGPDGVSAPRRLAPPASLAAAAATTIATDNFNRPDEYPVAGSWVSGPSTFPDLALTSGAIRGVTFDQTGAAYYGAASWPADQWSEARLTGLGSSGAGGVAVRVSSASATAYALGVGGGGTWFVVAKFVNGTYSEFMRVPVTFSVGDVIRLEVQRDTLRAYRNGALLASLVDGTIPSGSAGVVVYHDDPGFRLDDWSGGSWGVATPPPPATPAAPTGLTAAATSPTAIRLGWTDNAANEDGFRIERCTGAGCSAFTEIATVARDVTTWENGGLTAATSYTYRVRAFNAGGMSGYSNLATATTPAPPTASDRLPDLAMDRLANFSVRLSNGRRQLRYSTTIVNVGAGPFELHGRRASTADPEMPVVQRIFNDAGGWRDVATPAVMIYAGDGHNHWHVRDLQLVQLFRSSDGGLLAKSQKRGFCFWDNVEYQLTLPGAPPSPVYAESGCGSAGSLETAVGLSIGWGDIYPASLPDQYVDITGLADGRYRLMVTADPANWFAEVSDTNNASWADIELYGGGSRIRVLAYGP